MRRYQNLLESRPVSQSGTAHSDFEFPLAIFGASPDAVVFCGKVITRQTEPGPEPQLQTPESSGPTGGFFSWLRSPSGKENRSRKIGGSRKLYNGMFGTVKLPLQMELSDIKTRQERREPMPLPKFPATTEDHGGESCWELVRPLRRRGILMRALAKASLCIPIV